MTDIHNVNELNYFYTMTIGMIDRVNSFILSYIFILLVNQISWCVIGLFQELILTFSNLYCFRAPLKVCNEKQEET